MFSRPVDTISVKNSLGAEGAAGLIMETLPGFETEVVFCFETAPVYESRFVFKLKSGIKDQAGNESSDEHIFRIYADGYCSKPPGLVGIRMPMAPGNAASLDLADFGIHSLFVNLPITNGTGCYPSKDEIDTWIECYFETAPGAFVDPLSLMELFRIETSNNVLTFSPRQIKTGSFSVPDPRKDWEKYERLEIGGILVNTSNSGLVHFTIMPGLKDNNGNRNEKTFRISLVK